MSDYFSSPKEQQTALTCLTHQHLVSATLADLAEEMSRRWGIRKGMREGPAEQPVNEGKYCEGKTKNLLVGTASELAQRKRQNKSNAFDWRNRWSKFEQDKTRKHQKYLTGQATSVKGNKNPVICLFRHKGNSMGQAESGEIKKEERWGWGKAWQVTGEGKIGRINVCTGFWAQWKGRGFREYYLKLENSMFIPLHCMLPKWNTRCCSSSLIWPHSGNRGGQGQKSLYGKGS